MTATCVGKFWAVTSFLAAVASAVGYYFPYWLKGHIVDHKGEEFPLHLGVFRRCSYPVLDIDGSLHVMEDCGRYSTFLDIPSLYWQISTITIGSGTCLALLLSVIALMSLCFRDIVTIRLAVVAGLLQLSAGLLIGAGVAIYPKGWEAEEVQQACGDQASSYKLGHCSLFWAFYVTAIGGGLTILCSTLTCHAYQRKINNRRLEEDV